MKKWKIVLSSILISIAAVACGTAVGCKKNTDGNNEPSEWQYNSREHWHTEGHGEEHTFDENYECSVCGYVFEASGISISKNTTDYTLERLTRSIPTNDITVKALAADKLSEITLTRGVDYELEFYKNGTEKLDNLTKADGGTYDIWAKTTIGGETHDAFVVVYVVDQVKKFEREGTFTTTQELGTDEMSKTWQFRVTYTSGKTETIDKTDSRIKISNYSTYVATKNGKTALVSFTDTDCKGQVVEKSEEVLYNITNQGGNNTEFYSLSYEKIQETLENPNKDNQILSAENFTADNSFLTLLSGGTAQYRFNDKVKCLEIKGDDILSVTFEGVGLLVIGCRSTGDTNTSSIALKTVDGEITEYIAASYSGTTTTKDDDENIYSVTGSSNTLTFEITKPGTYTICTVVEVLASGDFIDTNRYTRIESLEMTDIRSSEKGAE